MAAAVRRAGAELILCGRTPHERLVVEREGGGSEIVPGPVLTDPAAVPGPPTSCWSPSRPTRPRRAAPFLRALCRDGTVVVVLQNGVEQRELVGPHAPGATVLPAVVWVPVEAVAPGHVRVRGDLRLTLPDEPAAHAIARADRRRRARRRLRHARLAQARDQRRRRPDGARRPPRGHVPPPRRPRPRPRARRRDPGRGARRGRRPARTRSPTSSSTSSPPIPRTSAPRSCSTARPAARSSGTPATASSPGWAPSTASRRRSAT